jgi:hypothetical protein
MVMVKVAVVAHWFTPGVNVKTGEPAMAVLIVAGLQVPVMPFVDVKGNDGATSFWQRGPMGLKEGAVGVLMLTVIVVGIPH